MDNVTAQQALLQQAQRLIEQLERFARELDAAKYKQANGDSNPVYRLRGNLRNAQNSLTFARGDLSDCLDVQ